MPRGVYQRKNQAAPMPEPPPEPSLEARIADLERRLEKANEYFQKGYVPPNV